MTWFDTPSVDDASEFELLPDGDYLAEVMAMEQKPNAKGTGEYVVVDFEVKRPKGTSKLKSFFNIVHTNEQAQRIGKGQFKGFLTALRVTDALRSFEDAKKKTLYKALYLTISAEVDQKGVMRNIVRKYISKIDHPANKESTSTSTIDDQTIPF